MAHTKAHHRYYESQSSVLRSMDFEAKGDWTISKDKSRSSHIYEKATISFGAGTVKV